MSQNDFFAAEIDKNISTIDLHESQTIPEALEQLEKELFLLFNTGALYVQVIHGIGSGRLSEAVHENFQKNPLIKNWKETEQGGSCIVLF